MQGIKIDEPKDAGTQRKFSKHASVSLCLCVLIFLLKLNLSAQNFYFGADLSYVNEIEDCGAVFKEDGQAKDVYQIFADQGTNLVRLRLWHTPTWYDNLNQGKRYSDLADVKKSIRRAKELGMNILLDFHLSDTWADPGKQIIPAAWLPVVNDLDLLQDSLYNYVFTTLQSLEEENLLPEMVQIGNETNRDILRPASQTEWTLDWSRNAPLFKSAIKAVRDLSADIQIALHIADPDNLEWWTGEFVKNGVTDFDIIGMSYYWTWHQPTDIAGTGNIVKKLKTTYPDKQIMVVETGYPWSNGFADAANNINNETDPAYGIASPENQKKWLIDLTQAVIDNGGSGLIYWEPAWVSTNCWTQWGRGSHYEQATFFDFDNNLLKPGGVEWMRQDYGLATNVSSPLKTDLKIFVQQNFLHIELPTGSHVGFEFKMMDLQGKILQAGPLSSMSTRIPISLLNPGVYIISVSKTGELVASKKFFVGN